jgi:hypothetical protein
LESCARRAIIRDSKKPGARLATLKRSIPPAAAFSGQHQRERRMNLEPGKNVTVTVTASVITPRAQKTLARLFLKDPARPDKRNHPRKPYTEKRRGGRWWSNYKTGTVAMPPSKGQSAKLTATVDVIRDLQSVAKYVSVK